MGNCRFACPARENGELYPKSWYQVKNLLRLGRLNLRGIPKSWGGSSAGRASRSQCEGREFDPPPLQIFASIPLDKYDVIPIIFSPRLASPRLASPRLAVRRTAAHSLGLPPKKFSHFVNLLGIRNKSISELSRRLRACVALRSTECSVHTSPTLVRHHSSNPSPTQDLTQVNEWRLAITRRELLAPRKNRRDLPKR